MQEELYARLDRELGQLTGGMFGEAVQSGQCFYSAPRDESHGDLATNVAMVLAKSQGEAPMVLAERIAAGLRESPLLESVEVAKPGFINVRLASQGLIEELERLLAAPEAYGESDQGAGIRVNVEYVSVNPTGPLHVGHARGAVFGDAIASLLTRIGYDVTREYYINDAGVQVDLLARSVYRRYLEALGDASQTFDAPLYPGDYLVPVGQALARRDGTRWQDAPESAWLSAVRDFAIDAMMDVIRGDLDALGVHQDVFTSERVLVGAGRIDETLDFLKAQNLVYRGVLEPPKGKKPDDWEPREQLLFKSTAFGDDVDRPLVKSDGSWTYFTPDMAYHHDKIRREFHWLINVFGADHIGYVPRLKAAVRSLVPEGSAPVRFDILCAQIVRFMENGEALKMSKRAGTFVGLRELIAAVGKDVVRLHLLGRKNDAQMDFDLQQLTGQSLDNPVFYIQYAHARCCSAIKRARGVFPALATPPTDVLHTTLDSDAERRLLCKICGYPTMLRRAGLALEIHRVAVYLGELSRGLHSYWHQGQSSAGLRVLVPDNAEVTAARVALLEAVRQVLADGLRILGVQAVEELR